MRLLISAPFAIRRWYTLYPAPLSPLDDNGSIAWSVRTLVQYIKPNTWPGKLQSSLLGYSPGFMKTATGDTDAPSRHSHAERSQLLFHSSHLSPNPASALSSLHDSQLHHLNSTTLLSLAICGASDTPLSSSSLDFILHSKAFSRLGESQLTVTDHHDTT